jgi:hypothetical protein
MLQALAHGAADRLRAKDPTFKQLMEERMEPKTSVEMATIEFIPAMSSPQTMQTSMMGWLKNQYHVTFNPTIGQNFFVHGLRDSQGKENFILFYFDLKEE